MSSVRIGIWNTEWATICSRRGVHLKRLLGEMHADILGITEGSRAVLPEDGYIITSSADYGYTVASHRRKVLLWSQHPWRDTDDLGSSRLPPGRYISGVTQTSVAPLKVIGVCVPWRQAHVRTGHKNRMEWQDHVTYLEGLEQILKTVSDMPTVIIGDFNQRMPGFGVPRHVSYSLEKALSGWSVVTSGLIAPLGLRAIDHLAHTGEFSVGDVMGISNIFNDGTRLSDHFGLCVTLDIAS